MAESRSTSAAKEVTSLLITYDGRLDVAKVEQWVDGLLAGKVDTPMLLELRALPLNARPMTKRVQRLLGLYLLVLGVGLLAVIPWAWSFASRAVTSQPGTVHAHFLGIGFTPTAEFSLVLMVLLAAVLGSVAVIARVFAYRSGYETLEKGFVWWYLTRPIIAAGLGLLFYMAVVAGFFSAATTKDRPALVIAAAIGGLAGLFTDQVLTKMRNALGLLPTNTPASGRGEAP